MTTKFTKLAEKFQGSSLPYQLYQIFRYGFLLLVSIALTWIFPDQEIIRQYELLLLLGGSLTFFWVSGLFDGFVVVYRQADAADQNGIVFQTFSISLPFALLSAVGTWLLGKYSLSEPLADEVILPFALFLLFDMCSHLLVYYQLVKQKNVFLIFYGLGVFLMYFLLLVVPLALGYSFSTGLYLLAALACAKFLFTLWTVRNALRLRAWPKKSFRLLVKIAGTLGLVGLLSFSAQYVDGYLVEHYFHDDFAVFRYGAKELPLVLLLANSMSVVRSGDIAEAMTTGQMPAALDQLKRSGLRLIHLMFPLSILLLAISAPLYTGVFGEDFAGSFPVFDLYLLLVIPRLLFPQTILRGYLKTSILSVSAGVELVLNVALSLILMQEFGIAGIAGATVIAFFIEKMLLVGYCWKVLKVSMDRYTPLLWWGGWSLILLLVWAWKYLI